jgi:hypothetical protein
LRIACFEDVGKAERFLISSYPMLDMRCPVECAMQSEAANAQAIAIRMGQGVGRANGVSNYARALE